ncbi:Galactose oxidase/kelch beta-propeller [Arabidopsis suecica]|uniref:Galactose oxidase/kelch beta-propeller n=2 Tax=Arabidopsis TaxID=3701 RepID=A0A8T2CJ04_ARASU|nr:Galactose oxidase/kelch beta-propeller [Arabidopsis suecica]
MKSIFHLAFVKATDYKLVWLYNCDKYIADASSPNVGVTKCEIFDFRKNAWRYLACTPSHRIFYYQKPASANGSVYWFTEPYNERIEVVAFDIHTETFRLLPKINPAIAGSDPHHIDMCTLDNSLSMSKREKDTMIQDIWRLKPSEDTWEKIFSIPVLLLGLRSVINLIGARRIGLSQPHPSRFVRIRRSFSHIAIPEVW